MPGRRIEFGFEYDNNDARLHAGALTVTSTVAFRFAGASFKDVQEAVAERVARGYKIGMRIRNGQQVERLAFRAANGFIELREDTTVSADLLSTFGAYPGEQWVGLVPEAATPRASTVSGDTITYEDVLVLRGFDAGPQLIPVVHTYSNVPFKEHYIVGVRLLSTRERHVGIRIDANY